MTPQAKVWLPLIAAEIYTPSLAGVARIGKSTTANEIASTILSFVENAPDAAKTALNLPTTIERFATSASNTACTLGIQAMVLPRFCDETGTQSSTMQGCFLLSDVEGINLGDTRHHTALLGLVTRFTTHLAFLSGGQFDFSILDNLDNLVSSNIVISGTPSSTASTTSTATGSSPPTFNFSNPHWPKLALAVTLYRLAAPLPDHSTWISNQLQDQPGDPARNRTRSTIRRLWLDPGKLTYHTVGLDSTLTMEPEVLSLMPQNAIDAMRAAYKASVRTLIDQIICCPELTMDAIVGKPASTTPPAAPSAAPSAAGSASGSATPSTAPRHIDGAFLCSFLSELITTYANTGTIPPDSAMARAIRSACKPLKKELDDAFPTRQVLAPYNLRTAGNLNDVDGARGTADDTAAETVKQGVRTRHNNLVAALLSEFNTRMVPFTGIGFDDVITEEREALKRTLDLRWDPIDTHWKRMRSIEKTDSEPSSRDGPSWTRVHHTEKEQVWFHTNTHYFWARYVHRYPTSRVVQTRVNGDIVYGPWKDVGSPFEVQTEGPWLGGAP